MIPGLRRPDITTILPGAFPGSWPVLRPPLWCPFGHSIPCLADDPGRSWLLLLADSDPTVRSHRSGVRAVGDGRVIDGAPAIRRERCLSAPRRGLHVAPRLYGITVTCLAFFFFLSHPAWFFPPGSLFHLQDLWGWAKHPG